MISETSTLLKSGDGRSDFDFLFGSWSVRNRRLREPLRDSKQWFEFESTAAETPLLGGLGNLEQYDAPRTPNGSIHAVALRLFDTQSKQWAIYWIPSGSGALGTPVVGGFVGGVGSFFGRETLNGEPIIVRFHWTRANANSCRWEQAFSGDGGTIWEVNWTMQFTRVPDESRSSTGAIP